MAEGSTVAVAAGVAEGSVVAVAVGVGVGSMVAVAVGVVEGSVVAVAVGVGVGSMVAVAVGIGVGSAAIATNPPVECISIAAASRALTQRRKVCFILLTSQFQIFLISIQHLVGQKRDKIRCFTSVIREFLHLYIFMFENRRLPAANSDRHTAWTGRQTVLQDSAAGKYLHGGHKKQHSPAKGCAADDASPLTGWDAGPHTPRCQSPERPDRWGRRSRSAHRTQCPCRRRGPNGCTVSWSARDSPRTSR